MTRTHSRRLSILGKTVKGQDAKRYYTISELTKLSGLTRRQIDYWTAQDLIAPSLRNSGVRGGKPASFYSASEALKILVFSDVKQRGFSLMQIRQLHRNLGSNRVRLDEAGSYLLTDGVSIFYARDEGEVIDILKSNGQMLLVPIHDQIKRLRSVA
jgi:DNA-binding transcriptional MerR regulator